MKKFGLLIGLLLFVFAKPVLASGVNFGVYPPITQIKASVPSVVESKITISNQSQTPQDLKIILRSFKASNENNGQVELLPSDSPPGGDSALFEKIEFLDNDNPVKKVHLEALESKSLNMKIVLDKSSVAGDYYFSVIFMAEGEAPDGTGSKLLSGIATNVLLAVGENIAPKVEIAGFTTPFFREKGPVALTLLISNKGKRFTRASGEVVITNMFGQNVGKLTLLPQNILANSNRYMKDKEQAKIKELSKALLDLKVKNEVIFWPETFLLGLYTAKATINLTDADTIRTSVTFIAIPVIWVSVFSIIILIALGITLKVMKKI